MKKLEMKDLTEAEKAEIALLLQKAQANADHQLTNGERNKIREEGRLKIVADRAEAAKAASKLAREKAKERAKNQVLPETFSWIDSVSNKFRSKTPAGSWCQRAFACLGDARCARFGAAIDLQLRS